MPPIIHFGINLGFARFVWGPQAALDIVRDELGLAMAEVVAEVDYGPALYLQDSEAFRRYHRAIGEYAASQGIRISSAFTYYRDGGAIAHPDPAIRRAASTSIQSLCEQAAAVGAPYACSSFMTANREDYAREPEACRQRAMECWTQWMRYAHQSGLRGLLLEMSAQPREECATIAQTRITLNELAEYHRRHPENTVPVELCYDVGHAISAAEAPDAAERDFRAWFRAFPDSTREVHLKNTDCEFLATWPFTPAHDAAGIIHPRQVLDAVKEHLRGEVYLILEVAGKRGREIGERAILDDLRISVHRWHEALRAEGFSPEEQGRWVAGE